MHQQWREIDYTDEDYDEFYRMCMEEKLVEERQHKLDILIEKSKNVDDISNKQKE